MADSLESVPSWVLATVTAGLIFIALLTEHAFHHLTACLKKRKRRVLNRALNQVKAELRNMGFMSLLLTLADQPVSKICVSPKDSIPPTDDHCGKKGKIPLVSGKSFEQLQVFIVWLAVIHVGSCLLILSLGLMKMKRWESWEEETKTAEHQLSRDPRRFMLIHQTSFARRRLRFSSNNRLLLWLVGFLQQLIGSVSKADYFALRHGFIMAHFGHDFDLDFIKYLWRSLDHDFAIVIGISLWIWMLAVLFISLAIHGFYYPLWMPFIPLTMLLILGTKLEVILTVMCTESTDEVSVIPGAICVKPDNSLFWFSRPRWILYLVQFILFQNSFLLAFFTWTWYKFGFRSHYHREAVADALGLGIGTLILFLCAYRILPLYSLVTLMGSSMKETIFAERVILGLRKWRRVAKRNLATRNSSPANPLLGASPSTMTANSPAHLEISRASSPSQSEISSIAELGVSGNIGQLEIELVTEVTTQPCTSDTPTYNREVSLAGWSRQSNRFLSGIQHQRELA